MHVGPLPYRCGKGRGFEFERDVLSECWPEAPRTERQESLAFLAFRSPFRVCHLALRLTCGPSGATIRLYESTVPGGPASSSAGQAAVQTKADLRDFRVWIAFIVREDCLPDASSFANPS